MLRNPWKDITFPKKHGTENERREQSGHSLKFYFRLDFEHTKIFVFRADCEKPDNLILPQFEGFEVQIEKGNSEKECQLIMRLLDNELLEMFYNVCIDLLSATRKLSEEQSLEAIKVIMQRLERWKRLLSSKKEDELSKQSILGIIVELFVHRDFAMYRFDEISDAIESWVGPPDSDTSEGGDLQDFNFPYAKIEVKSQGTTRKHVVSINSEDQLQISGRIEKLFLCHQTFDTPSTSEQGAVSLNKLITSLAERIGEKDEIALGAFMYKLANLGYAKKEKYDSPFYLKNTRTIYEVKEDFPRIESSMFNKSGIEKVKYDLRLEDCSDFIVCEVSAKESSFNDKD